MGMENMPKSSDGAVGDEAVSDEAVS